MGYFNATEMVNYIDRLDEHEKASVFNKLPYGIRSQLTDNSSVVMGNDWRGDFVVSVPYFNYDDADHMIRLLHKSLIAGHFTEWKAFRPWDVVDLTANLDPTKAWVGWEVETGWITSGARSAQIACFLNSWDYVCVDDEGPHYGCEFTWSPKEADFYDEDKHPLLFFTDNNDEHYDHNPDEHVGTHINISTPSSREDGRCLMLVCAVFNRSLKEMSFSDKEELFGRGRLYGGFFDRRSWVEGKLFNSTYDEAQARHYIRVGQRLTELMEHICASAIASGKFMQFGSTITNFANYLHGVDTEIKISWANGSYVDGDMLEDEYDDDYYDEDDECMCDECQGVY